MFIGLLWSASNITYMTYQATKPGITLSLSSQNMQKDDLGNVGDLPAFWRGIGLLI